MWMVGIQAKFTVKCSEEDTARCSNPVICKTAAAASLSANDKLVAAQVRPFGMKMTNLAEIRFQGPLVLGLACASAPESLGSTCPSRLASLLSCLAVSPAGTCCALSLPARWCMPAPHERSSRTCNRAAAGPGSCRMFNCIFQNGALLAGTCVLVQKLLAACVQAALKLADIAHTAAARPVHQEWTRRLETEFYMQGDREREVGLPVSPLMDRHNPQGISSSQVSHGLPVPRVMDRHNPQHLQLAGESRFAGPLHDGQAQPTGHLQSAGESWFAGLSRDGQAPYAGLLHLAGGLWSWRQQSLQQAIAAIICCKLPSNTMLSIRCCCSAPDCLCKKLQAAAGS